MKQLMNPTLLVRNLEGPHWLVAFEHDFENGERIDLTVKVQKSERSLDLIEKEAFDRATELLQIVSRQVDKHMSSGGMGPAAE